MKVLIKLLDNIEEQLTYPNKVRKVIDIFLVIITFGAYYNYIKTRRRYLKFKEVVDTYSTYSSEIFDYIKTGNLSSTEESKYLKIIMDCESRFSPPSRADFHSGSIYDRADVYKRASEYIEKECVDIPYFKNILRERNLDDILNDED